MQENLKESSVRPKTSMKIPMTTDDINQLMESGVLTNDNPLGLFRKVWFDLTLHLGCGGQAALRALTKDSFVTETDERGRRYIRLNHNIQGQRDRSCMEMQYWNWDGRMYELPGDPNCPVHSMELYLAKRNPHKDAFFQRPKTHYNSGSLWYESPVGHGVLASLMSKMSEDSCLSRAYTNSSVRVTLADILEEKGLNVENILGINPKNKSVKSMMNRSSNHSSDELERNSKIIHEALYGPVTC
ncbi:hypothetical protein KUTeg_022999 [Tegillarca granosa]|uniref:DUF3504 domain-containing protein n=1 Tax=Tegillarca granosa TaxID=220873 RepID=A0ABQ9E0C3_TEGGR|nr:hypothetical protein KUTeg_022999 [Tegillarca granosa]